MGRPRTRQVIEAKQRLIARLREGFHRPGDRFLSNRAVAEQFGVSYQTADRLIRELVNNGLLQRRAASGTYVPGQRVEIQGVQLIFHRRARRKASFGARLLRELTERLDRERVDWRMTWAQAGKTPTLAAGRYPVVWESLEAIEAARRDGRAALLLNQRPAAGLDAVRLDSVSVDDFSGGACAAQLLLQAGSANARRAIISGPRDDPRSAARVAGFLSVAKATVIPSPDWFLEGGLTVAAHAVASGGGGIFCCNDRLAEAVVRWCQEKGTTLPPLVGFDDAPVARWLELTTIAIPWLELVAAATAVIRRRIQGDNLTAIAQMVATRPIIRRSLRDSATA